MTKDMKVIDNFMPEDIWPQLRDMIMDPRNSFPWSFTPETLQDGLLKVDPLDGYQFTHTAYTVRTSFDDSDIPKGTCVPVYNKPSFEHFLPFLNNPKLNCKALIKLKLNLNPRRSTVFEHGFHVDNDIPGAKTAVLYFNDNNGYTIFEKTGEKVYSKENRIVIFNNNEKHSGTTTSDTNRRVIMNINFFDNTLDSGHAKVFDKAFRSGSAQFWGDYRG